MAPRNDPTKRFEDITQKYQIFLTDIWKRLFKKLQSRLKPFVSFFDKLASAAKQIASKVGKAVVKQVQQAGKFICETLEAVPSMAKAALRLGKKILDLVRKAADPNEIIDKLKRLFSRYSRMLRAIFNRIMELIKQLNAISPVLAVINAVKRVLQLVIAWISEVTRAGEAVKKAQKLMMKMAKVLKKEIKEIIALRKEIIKLKPA